MATKIVHWSIGDAPLKDISLTAVIGNFDGVHFGHQKLISTALELAKNDGTKVGVITFDPHPRRYFRRNEAGFLLSDITDFPLSRGSLFSSPKKLFIKSTLTSLPISSFVFKFTLAF